MDFLVVNDSKLKIMMGREDMKEYEIDGDDIDYENPRIRRAFWRILDVAKEECGFESAGDKILIQYYPAKDGCEIFVTKLGLISQGAERTIAKSGKVAMLETKRRAYKFSDYQSLLGAVRMIKTVECEGEPRIFRDDIGEYYILTEERISANKAKEISYIAEYGAPLPALISDYIAEHATELDFNTLRKLR